MYRLYIDDYFDAEDLNDFLYSQGWEMTNRTWTALSTNITIEPLGDAIDFEDLVVLMKDHFYVRVHVV